MPSRFYITTAIDYVNQRPHLGNAYEKIVSDCLARFHRQRGDATFFLTGTDEHGQKIARVAEGEGVSPKEFTDRLSAEFRACYDALDITYDRWIRTTEPAHEAAVQEWFRRAYRSGDIYSAEYEGLYCVPCEAFYQSKDLNPGDLCPVHDRAVQTVKETNFFFRLSAYTERLRKHIGQHPEFVLPVMRRNEVMAVLDAGLEDVSVSRASVSWGVPVPPEIENAEGQTIYVWVDALLNYITAIGFPDDEYRQWWLQESAAGGGTPRSNALHIIGKDISRFHCLIWPAMLWAADIELPRCVFVHGFIQMGGEKLSKTSGRMLDPLEVTKRYGVDSLRYFILREIPFGRDGEFSWELLVERYNADLANELGNLVSRSCSMLHRYRGGVVPREYTAGDRERELQKLAAEVADRVRQGYLAIQPSAALEATWSLVKRANRYVEETKPWGLAKQSDRAAELDTALVTLIECARLVGFLAWPAIPRKCEQLWASLGIADSPGCAADAEEDRRGFWFEGGEVSSLAGNNIPEVEILFPRIEVSVGRGA